jgi:hypothetical protein
VETAVKAHFFRVILVLCSLPAPLLAARLELRQAGTGSTEIVLLVGQEVEVELWIDSEGEALSGSAVFLSFDPDYFALVEQDRTPQAGFQPFAPGLFLGSGEVYRNDLLEEDDPAASAPGRQLDYSVVRANDQGAGAVASFRLRALAPARDSTIRIDENGVRETRFFLPDGRQRAFRFIAPLRVVVQGISIRGLPERLVLPRGAIDEHTFQLDELIFDPLYSPAEIVWSISPISALSLERDPGTNSLRLEAPRDASPWERLMLTATNPAGQTASDTVDIFVNAAPHLLPVGPLVFAEDNEYELALDALVDDPDTPADQLQWSASPSPELRVAIQGPPYLARFSARPDWHGPAGTLLMVADPFGFADTLQVPVRVEAVNDPPRLLAAPNVRLTRGRQDSSLVIADLVADVEDTPAELRLSWSGAARVQLEKREGRLVLSNKGEWLGTEEIILIVEDSGGLTAAGPLTVTVVPSLPPALLDPPRRLGLAAGEHRVLTLDNLVVDPDDPVEVLSWKVSGQQRLRVQLSSSRQARLEAPADFVGIETLTFTAADPTGESISFALTVFAASAGGEPLIAPLPEISVPLDGLDASLDLDEYVFDLDHEPGLMEFFLTELDDLNLRVDPLTHVLIVEPLAHARTGTRDIELRVVDPDGHEALSRLRVRIIGSPESTSPSFSLEPAPAVELVSGALHTFDLDAFVRGELEPAQISWRVEDEGNLIVVLDPATHEVGVQSRDGWSGAQTIVFVAAAGDLPEQRLTVLVIVRSGETPAEQEPRLAALPRLVVQEGAFEQTLDLDEYLENGQAADFAWEISGGAHVRVLVDGQTHQLIAFADRGWSGEEVLTLIGRDAQGHVLEAVLRIEVQSALPSFSLRQPIEVLLLAGAREIRLSAQELLDGQADPGRLAWSASGSLPLTAAYDPGTSTLILTAESPWQSSDLIQLRAVDPQGREATGLVLAQVFPADGSAGAESPDFQLALVPNALQPDFVDVFAIAAPELPQAPRLRVQEDGWSDLKVESRAPGIWQGSHVLRPGQQGEISFLALAISKDQQVLKAAFTLSVGPAAGRSAKTAAVPAAGGYGWPQRQPSGRAE